MNERPIIFSSEMVRAILDGRKSQTRRIIKPPKWSDAQHAGVDYGCPYGWIGDQLWVRETWFVPLGGDASDILFRADGVSGIHDWCPSIFMPRWASRILLEITDVRVERLQNMSFYDWVADFCPSPLERARALDTFIGTKNMIEMAKKFWDSLNKKRGYGWETNPWLWVISFKRIKEGEDER